MRQKVRVALVGAVVLLVAALVVQQGLGAPAPQPSIDSNASLGAAEAGRDGSARGEPDRDDNDVEQINPDPQPVGGDDGALGGNADSDDGGGD